MRAHAQDLEVPVGLQVELLARLLWYERGLQKSAAREIGVLIVARADDPESARAAAQLAAQFDRIKQVAGKPVRHSYVTYESSEQMLKLIDQQKPYLIYLSTSLAHAAASLARELVGSAVLTVSADSGDTAVGAVLGFELESSKPHIMLNLKQARAQKLDFSAQVLRVVRVLP